ncbi:hypothetical protein [Novipirellula artificiosorum]|uniref:Lipoprotein n=1 Tax=Novipirellula artificiosorum TaxID=2528016 RepID=A0A5C6DWG6_9BACT|nr:hypothetical protein [Novipirellula artificiosorum]TWU40574.1 hypothetical protein Poly41_14070 [Novipirellula artificiosorum]
MGNRSIIGIAFVATVSSGCMIVGLDDKFTLAERFSKESPIESCVLVAEPIIEHDVSRLYFPFVRIDNRRLPHDLVVNLYKQTGLQVGPDFETVVFESIKMVYPDGRRKVLLAADQPHSQRTFPVAEAKQLLTEETQVRFAGAVDQADSFVLTCLGTAVSQSGPGIPFETRLRYRYDGKNWDWMTLSQEFGSCGGI